MATKCSTQRLSIDLSNIFFSIPCIIVPPSSSLLDIPTIWSVILSYSCSAFFIRNLTVWSLASTSSNLESPFPPMCKSCSLSSWLKGKTVFIVSYTSFMFQSFLSSTLVWKETINSTSWSTKSRIISFKELYFLSKSLSLPSSSFSSNPLSCFDNPRICLLFLYITSRWRLRTSSYSNKCFLISKLCPSTFFWAPSNILVIIFCSIGISSGTFNLSITPFILSPAKIRIKSSSVETKNWVSPGSPWRAERPLNWLSILLDSCLSVPNTNNPPARSTVFIFSPFKGTPPSLMSTPRPAMLVARVTEPGCPAWAIISPSLSWFLAFKISCSIPWLVKKMLNSSFFSTEIVPTRTGCPFVLHSCIFFAMAMFLPFSLLYILSGWSTLTSGLLVGITITSK